MLVDGVHRELVMGKGTTFQSILGVTVLGFAIRDPGKTVGDGPPCGGLIFLEKMLSFEGNVGAEGLAPMEVPGNKINQAGTDMRVHQQAVVSS